MISFVQKWDKTVQIQHIFSSSSLLLSCVLGSVLLFSDKINMNFRSIFGDSNDKIYVTSPLTKWEWSSRMCLECSRKFEDLSKSWLIAGCYDGKTHLSDQVISVTYTLQFISTHFAQKYVFTIHVQSLIRLFRKRVT